jgi:murein DD-endopeptidase
LRELFPYKLKTLKGEQAMPGCTSLKRVKMIRRNFILWSFLFVAVPVLLSPILTAQLAPLTNDGLDVQVPAAPTAVRIDGRTCLAYELHITNFRTANLTLTRVDVLAGRRGNAVLHSYEGAELASALLRAGARPDQSDKRVIAAGQRAIVFLWLALDHDTPVPLELRHTISFRVSGPSGDAVGVIQVTAIDVAKEPPVIVGPPLRGGPWVAVYDPSLNGGHRRVLFAIDGKARIPARFAIDWIKLGRDGRTSQGDASVMSNSYSYGADVLAVAEGSVAALQDGLPEPTPRTSVNNDAGNFVVLDLGGGRFAFYEHLKPGSIRVKIGERVRTGQVLGALGGSGSVFSGPHLHFHVADTQSPLGAEGLPFVFNSFELLGVFESLEALASGRPWAAKSEKKSKKLAMEMPKGLAVVQF